MNRRDEILTAAAGVFAQHGFRGSTTRRIADAAGVNEITLFRQFGSKEALMREAMKHLSESAGLTALPKVPGDPAAELTGWSESFIQHLRLRSSIIRKTMGEIEERPEMSQCASYVPTQASNDLCLYLTALKEQGKAAEEFDPKTAAAMLMEGGLPNFFTINGKSWPATDTLRLKVGETIKLRIIGTNNNFIHPMHMHGGPFTVIARDGVPLNPAARFQADVINVGPGQRWDVIWPAREPGKWIFHCHIPHHTLNNNVEERGAGGLTLLIEVAP